MTKCWTFYYSLLFCVLESCCERFMYYSIGVGMFIFWFYSKYSIIIGNFIVYKECIYYINFCTYSMKINMYTYIKKCMYYIHSVLNCFIHSQTREGEFTGIFTHIHCLVHFMITCFLLTYIFFFFNAMSLQSLGNHDSPQISFLYYLWIAMHLLRACNAWSTPKPQTYKIYHLQATIWNKDKTRFNQI